MSSTAICDEIVYSATRLVLHLAKYIGDNANLRADACAAIHDELLALADRASAVPEAEGLAECARTTAETFEARLETTLQAG